jgi:Spy/CpxP family protein refolding chaperone
MLLPIMVGFDSKIKKGQLFDERFVTNRSYRTTLVSERNEILLPGREQETNETVNHQDWWNEQKERRKAMKGYRSIVAFWVLVYILVGWVGVYAADTTPGHPGKGHGRHGEGFAKIVDQLKLTESQKHEIAGILKQNREEARGLRDEMMEARKSLVEAITGDAFNENAVREAVRKAAHTGEELAVLRAKAFDAVRKVLTPEQTETLHKIKADFSSRIRHEIGHRMAPMDRWIDQYSGG